jgi:hypothetical protein
VSVDESDDVEGTFVMDGVRSLKNLRLFELCEACEVCATALHCGVIILVMIS